MRPIELDPPPRWWQWVGVCLVEAHSGIDRLRLSSLTSGSPSRGARVQIGPRGSPYVHRSTIGVSDTDKAEVHSAINESTRRGENRPAVQVDAER